MMIMMINCFYGMDDQRKVFSLIYSQDHSSSSSIFDAPQAWIEPVQNLSSGVMTEVVV